MNIRDYANLHPMAARATGLVKKTFEIEAPPDVMRRFEKFLSYVQWCAGVGHSTDVAFSIDGDGADRFYVNDPKLKWKGDHAPSKNYVEYP